MVDSGGDSDQHVDLVAHRERDAGYNAHGVGHRTSHCDRSELVDGPSQDTGTEGLLQQENSRSVFQTHSQEKVLLVREQANGIYFPYCCELSNVEVLTTAPNYTQKLKLLSKPKIRNAVMLSK